MLLLLLLLLLLTNNNHLFRQNLSAFQLFKKLHGVYSLIVSRRELLKENSSLGQLLMLGF